MGPATLVAAAFIGPGTVTACMKAGAGFGMSLLLGFIALWWYDYFITRDRR